MNRKETRRDRKRRKRWETYLRLEERLAALPTVKDDRDPALVRKALERARPRIRRNHHA